MITILFLVVLVLLLTVQFAAANPLEDFFGGLFGGPQPPAPQVRKSRSRAHASLPVIAGGGSLLAVAQRYVGARNFTGFRGPWCGAAMSIVASEATGRHYWILRARDWARVGRPTAPHPGAVAVLPHHVGTVRALDEDGNPYLAGGNQSGRFSIKRFPARNVIAYREIE
ncbi:hypothetical protein [Methylosinus sp. PW1]|uniref:hypothetical protein n=1 Tax=Methylosinus sp. PW1 TaxID=107636 RepID=UPI00056BD58C|nr:hypothetical protein [Methylosinus sp. PW1]